MSNEAHLTWSPSPVANGISRGDLPESILYAYYFIPLFWYALFDDESIIEVADGEFRDLAMCKPTRDAVLLSRERWPRIRGLFDKSFEPQFVGWVDFLETGTGAHVICKTKEWAGMFRTAALFREEPITCLTAFDHVPKHDVRPARLNKWWRKLLGQCYATIQGGRIVAEGAYSFWGHGWRPPGHPDD